MPLQEREGRFLPGATYLDEKSPQRAAALAAAEKAFDTIFQAYRESLVGLHAHLWQGRVADAQGNDVLALDIYDEVLATAPEGAERETGLEPLFAQVQYHRFKILERKTDPEQFVTEAKAWLDAHKNPLWKKLDGYQGVVLEAAKANLKLAAEAKGAKKSSLTQAAITALGEIGAVKGEHQQEAILLRRQYIKSEPADLATVKTVDEALALGDSAAQRLDWPEAAAAYARGLEMASSTKDAKRAADVAERLDRARLQMAVALHGAEKFDECLATAEAIIGDRPDGPLAPAASSLAVSAAVSLCVKNADKQPALARLEQIAHRAIERWPSKPEADDARIALGQASLMRGELPVAIAAFEQVNPRSQRYPAAMYLAGQTHWRIYLANKAKKVATDEAANVAEREKAEEELRTSLAGQRKDAAPRRAVIGTGLRDAVAAGRAEHRRRKDATGRRIARTAGGTASQRQAGAA